MPSALLTFSHAHPFVTMTHALFALLAIVSVSHCYAEGSALPQDANSAARTFIRLQIDRNAIEETYKDAARHMASRLGAMIEVHVKRNLTEIEKRDLQDFWHDKLRAELSYAAIEDGIVPVINAAFTPEELLEANRFLATPLGRKLQEFSPQIRAQARIAGQTIGAKIITPSWIYALRRDFIARFPQWESVIPNHGEQ